MRYTHVHGRHIDQARREQSRKRDYTGSRKDQR
jgi:hypothetical protein